LILTEHLSLAFERPVLHDVSLSVPSGSLFGLFGPGASGKSVLLKALAGLLPATAGSIAVDDTIVTSADEHQLFDLRRRMGMLFQNNALFDFMSVAENVAFPLRQLLDVSAEEARERVSQRLTRVGLPGFESRMPAGLSGGQKKRVGVARASITQAKVLLYDEPCAGLDPVSSQKLFELLRNEQREHGSTVVIVSSDLERLLAISDHVGMMLDGRLIFQGPIDNLYTCDDPYVRQFVRGETDGPL
jgi:phospholipid/cholesterol/gamma-HCH transport system ATP-binding protein